MESSPRKQASDQYSPDVTMVPEDYPQPILLHYQGRIYELEVGSVYQEIQGYMKVSGDWVDVTDEGEPHSANVHGYMLNPCALRMGGEPWIPTEEELTSNPLNDAVVDKFMSEFAEDLRVAERAREEEAGLVHRPVPRYGR